MRSHTSDDLPGRCRRCWVREAFCICPELPQLVTKTQVLVVRHERESFKSTGTARIAGLALTNARIVDVGEATAEADVVLHQQLQLDDACLLFPGPSTAPWPSRAPSQLVVLDGTWRQTRRMFTKLPSLHGLPRLQLPPKANAVLRLRESTFAEGRSTLEAIADALEVLEGPEVAAPLHRLHQRYVELVFRARGVWDLKKPASEGAVESD